MVIGILSLTNHQNTGLGRNPDQSTDPNEPQPLQPLQALRCRCNRVTLAVKMLSPMAAPAMAMFNYHGNPLVIQHSHRKLAIFLDDLSIDPNSHGTFGHIYIWVCLEMAIPSGMGLTNIIGKVIIHHQFSVYHHQFYQTQRRLSQPQIGIRPTQNGFLICFNMF